MPTVNDHHAEIGVYIDSHHGQYGIDRLEDVCRQFGISWEQEGPTECRRLAERYAEDGDERLAHHWWECHHEAGYHLEHLLNAATTGGIWHWWDGDFHLSDLSDDEDYGL